MSTSKRPAPRASRAAAPPASDAARQEWLRRVEAEYRSAAITQHLGLWLIQLGVSPDLVRDALRIVDDELVHAELSHAVYVAAGGREAPRLPRETLGIAHDAKEPLEALVTRACVDVFCLGETVAVPLFRELRAGCTAKVARVALDRILRDEVRHRDFGWDLLGWLLGSPHARQVRGVLDRELTPMLARVHRAYAPNGAATQTGIDDVDRAWGLMPGARYGEILTRAALRDYFPRFDRLGIDARDAWKRASS